MGTTPLGHGQADPRDRPLSIPVSGCVTLNGGNQLISAGPTQVFARHAAVFLVCVFVWECERQSGTVRESWGCLLGGQGAVVMHSAAQGCLFRYSPPATVESGLCIKLLGRYGKLIAGFGWVAGMKKKRISWLCFTCCLLFGHVLNYVTCLLLLCSYFISSFNLFIHILNIFIYIFFIHILI